MIGKVFPPPLVAKVTRLLLSRILNDPVYGVQVRWAGVTCFFGAPVGAMLSCGCVWRGCWWGPVALVHRVECEDVRVGCVCSLATGYLRE